MYEMFFVKIANAKAFYTNTQYWSVSGMDGWILKSTISQIYLKFYLEAQSSHSKVTESSNWQENCLVTNMTFPLFRDLWMCAKVHQFLNAPWDLTIHCILYDFVPLLLQKCIVSHSSGLNTPAISAPVSPIHQYYPGD